MREGWNEQSLEGSTLAIAERQKLHEKALSCKNISIQKNMHTLVRKNTHAHINTNKNWQHNVRRKIGFAPVKWLETQLFSVMEFTSFDP